VHFQLRNYSECIFYNQQAIRIDPNFAGALALIRSCSQAVHVLRLRHTAMCVCARLVSPSLPGVVAPDSCLAGSFRARSLLSARTDVPEAYGNLGNALKELGDLDGAIQFYLKVRALRCCGHDQVVCVCKCVT
jgi:hypothetical protein